MIEVITSFNKPYFDKIGRDCVSSWLAHWPQTWSMTCYVEGFAMEHHDRIQQLDFDVLHVDYAVFQAQDAVKSRCKTFAKKAYCVIHAMTHSKADWILWLDADVITQRPGIEQVIQQTLISRYLTVHLGVTYTSNKNGQSGDWYVPETGLFAVNLKHPGIAAFVSHYQDRYIQRDSSGLRRFYDNDVFGAAVRATSDYAHLDLCRDLKKSYRTPLKHTVFGQYLHHYKAQHSKIHYQNQVKDQ